MSIADDLVLSLKPADRWRRGGCRRPGTRIRVGWRGDHTLVLGVGMTSAIEHAVAAVPGHRCSSAGWVRAWPLYPLLLLIVAFFLYPVLQILWLSLIRPGRRAVTAEHYLRGRRRRRCSSA